MNALFDARLLSAARDRTLTYALLKEIARQTARSAPDLADELSRFVAEEYFAGRMGYEDADSVMNCLWSTCVSQDFWADHDKMIPEIMMMVYLAFDAGEFHRKDDPSGTDPTLKYTMPLIAEFLATYGQTDPKG